MSRVIRYFEKDGDKCVGEEKLPEIDLGVLQELFDLTSKNPMYDCFLVTEKQRTFLNQFIKVEINLNEYDYFIEFDSDS